MADVVGGVVVVVMKMVSSFSRTRTHYLSPKVTKTQGLEEVRT